MIGSQNIDISALESRWTNLESAISAYSERIEAQKQMVRQQVEEKVKTVKDDIDKFYSRWQAIKSKDTTEFDAASTAELLEKNGVWQQECANLEERMKAITKECEHFSMDKPKFPNYDSIIQELNEQ